MEKLYQKLKHFTIEDAYKFENEDRQFIALKKLEKTFNDKNVYLWLIVANSIICYQLSWKWEDYWEEFSSYFSWKDFKLNKIILELSNFIKQSKNNRRFVETKINRLKKIDNFLNNFDSKKYFLNMINLRDELSFILNQKKDAKTIVFAIKMFSYWSRLIFGNHICPDDIFIPIDSRLKKIFEKYKENYVDEKIFYDDLSKKIWIPPLHLDAILWVNYTKIMED